MKPTNRRTQAWMVLVLAGLLSSALEAQQRVAFVTSVEGTAVFGTWPEAGSAVGADAADAICQNLATAAALDNPGNFVAWVSTGFDDAYCRLHGFSGKITDKCGQATLPVNAGPWVRTDGQPFGETIDRLLTPDAVVYYPLAKDENGDSVYSYAFTATGSNGTLYRDNVTCGDWTLATADLVQVGQTLKGSVGWASGGGQRCNGSARIYCLETGAGPPLTPPAEEGAVAFVTSVDGTADLGSWTDAGGKTSYEAADEICRNRAAAGSLENPADFEAWISTSMRDAKDRFTTKQPIVRPDGVKVADDIDDLTDAWLDAPINVTELGKYITNYGVWTATNHVGELLDDTCSDWTSASSGQSARAGSAYAADLLWTMAFTLTCDFNASRLYCIEDRMIPIFKDGFESGDTTAWSSTVQRPLELR